MATNEEPTNLFRALILLTEKRKEFEPQTIVDFASAYNLKQQFAVNAGQLVLHFYGIVVEQEHILNKPFYVSEGFDFLDPMVQIAYWVDSLLHNCRGALETLGQIINYVYSFGLKENESSFNNALMVASKREIGISFILNDIKNDAWFTIITQLRNKSYHRVVNTFVPKIGYGIPQRFTIRFFIDPTKGNLTHDNLSSFLNAGFKFREASMELDEFALFIATRLQQYLLQVENIIKNDCLDISQNKQPRSNYEKPKLVIPFMRLNSWRNLVRMNDTPYTYLVNGDLE